MGNVRRGMFADYIQNRCGCLAGVVQIGKPVGQTRSEVQKCGGRFARHAGIAISSTSRDPLKQAKVVGHTRRPGQGCHQVHFGGAGIGETGIDAIFQKDPYQGFGAVLSHGGFTFHFHTVVGPRVA